MAKVIDFQLIVRETCLSKNLTFARLFSCFGGKTSGTLTVKSEEIARSPEYPAVQRRGRE